MIPELGIFSLILALCLAVVQGILPIAGALRGNPSWILLARPAAFGQSLFVLLAFTCLAYSFVNNDFSIVYVAANSNSSLPAVYRFAGTWGGHEGSLLLWTLMLAFWTSAVAKFSQQLPEEMVAQVLGVMGLISVGFLSFMLFTSNPFQRLLPGAADGRDLNPLLQDFGMIVHPPLLYMGYVGFSVAFSFAIAALISGKLDSAWARWSRPWTLIAWMFMTLGIFLGSFWAYYELGWGGWWFWDAVENASLMPSLVGTALIHSLVVTEKRGSFRNWTVLLAIMAFSLSLLGTFLVRSGVLTSVHAFATDPRRGLFILVFLTIVIGGSLLLFAWRAPQIGMGGRFNIFSRESMLLLNNVLLVVVAGTILLGTLYPLFLDALNLGKISVGPPYFEAVFVPLMLPVLLLLAVGPYMRWKESSLNVVMREIFWVVVGTLFIVIIALILFRVSTLVAVGLGTALWILLATIRHLLLRLRHVTSVVSLSEKLTSLSFSYWGMLIAHTGIAIFIIGVTLVKGFEVAEDKRMNIGGSSSVGGYVYHFKEVNKIAGPNYISTQAIFNVTKDEKSVTTLIPEKRFFTVQKMPMTEAAIDRGFTRDLYIALGEQLGESTWVVRIQHKPFVSWIWSGCLIMALGGLFAAFDRRYRVGSRKQVMTNSENEIDSHYLSSHAS